MSNLSDMKPTSFTAEDVFKFNEILEEAKDPQLLVCNDSIFEQSYAQSDRIKTLPYQDTCWAMEEVELGDSNEQDTKRVIIVSELSFQSTQEVVEMSVALTASVSLEKQTLHLLSHACLHPRKKHARRPHYLLLKNNVNERSILKDIQDFGINLIGTSLTDTVSVNVNPPEEALFYVCHNCGLKATQDFFITCPKCSGVYYCDETCQTEAYHQRHRLECQKFSACMNKENSLGRFCFEFSEVCTHRKFTKQKLFNFLKCHDVFDQGLWRRECQLSCYNDTPYGALPNDEKLYVLPLEGIVLQSALVNSISIDEPLKDWSDYYNLRGFWLDSPIAGLLYYPLTLYWIITTCLPKHYPEVFENMKTSHSVEVHVLGAEKEAEMFHPFLELARLLSPLKVQLHLFGDQLVHHSSCSSENLSFSTHPGLYHASISSVSTLPHIAIGFNAGLSAYPSFKETLEILLHQRCPVYCTDYCYLSLLHSRKALKKSKLGSLSDAQINPFRCPFRIFTSDSNLPRYSNAWAFHIKSLN
ncbi:zinc finger MYND domain-containing protein 15 [Biomphalaria glabrata]|nr:zinc finger MYND domain-containing protein 15 [Biomphalaria glabrata]